VAVPAGLIRGSDIRLDRLIAEQEHLFSQNQPQSWLMAQRARKVLAGGVNSSWQSSRPQPIWVSHGKGSKVYDLDGHELVDLHNGYGVMLVGHAHPAVVRAVSDRVVMGTHFAQPTPDSVIVAEDLAARFGLPLWRFGNSGTEATMDATHLMRAYTGRDLIIKVVGSYHGHHDSLMVSTYSEGFDLGSYERPRSLPANPGIPRGIVDLTLVMPFNDLSVAESLFLEHGDRIAGVIVEPIMMNVGMILPQPGYLEGLRGLTSRYGALLTFDEVKTGLTVGPGGATRLFGVRPDLICLAKALGGGLPAAAIGGTAEVMELIVSGRYDQVGTFNGNPLSMAAARAVLTEVLTEGAYRHLNQLNQRMTDGAEEVIARWELPAYVAGAGAKGSVIFSESKALNYRHYLNIDGRYAHANWLFQYNGGVFLPPWGKGEQWMLSVQHRPDDADRFVENFATFASALRD
jgi:glutamate-1-semialdehyde 2,1-aminomutase